MQATTSELRVKRRAVLGGGNRKVESTHRGEINANGRHSVALSGVVVGNATAAQSIPPSAISTALFTAIALLTVSCHSAAGSESATMPAPAWR